MNALRNVFGRLRAVNEQMQQQRESFLQRKRERFLSVHNSDTPPPELLAPPLRRLRWISAFVWIYLLLYLFLGIRVLERAVVGALGQVEAREAETRQWVEKQIAKSSGNEREAKRHKLLLELGESEAEMARQLRWTILCASTTMALITVVLPVALLWLFSRVCHLLRNGAVTRAELLSRRLWPSSDARLRFATAGGEQVEVTRTIPLYVPIGTRLWVFYSRRNPKRSLVYFPCGEIAKLLRP